MRDRREDDFSYHRRRADQAIDNRIDRLSQKVDELDAKVDALTVKLAIGGAILAAVMLLANIAGPVIARQWFGA